MAIETKLTVKKGLVILSDEEDDFAPRPFNRVLLFRLLAYLKPYKWRVAGMVAAALTTIVTALVLPYLIKIGIDRCIIGRDLERLGLVALVYAGVSILQYLSIYCQGVMMITIGQKAIFDLRQDLFEHLQFLSLSFFDRQKAGRIMIRVTNDVNALEELLSSGVSSAFADSFTLIGLLGVMFWIDWRLSLIIFLTLPVTIWVAIFLRNRMLDVSRRIRSKLSAVNANLNESLQGIRVTQAFAREGENTRLFEKINDEHFKAAMRFVPLNAFFWPWIGFLNTMGNASVLLTGGFLILHGWVTLGTIAAFMNYINRFFQPIQNLSNLLNIVSTAMASCERIFELMDLKPAVTDPDPPVSLGIVTGRVSFDRVNFGYGSGESVLQDFALEAEPGETIAIVGPTGAGKSTIINLLCRFYDPESGRILIDGKDLRYVSQTEYRKQIAVVLQDTFIFSGTVAENIRYGKPGASREEVEAAARVVGIHDYIVSLPQGYDSAVQERGSSLSVGQRQLIAFARALLRNPRILILDEATSSIDTKTEQELQLALGRLLKGRTSFIIAHRLSTIRKADLIIVVSDGRIVESGSHNELVDKGGVYATLCREQYRAG